MDVICLVIGHSFVNRLDHAIHAGSVGVHHGFNLSQCEIKLLVRGGKRIATPFLRTFQPHVVHLEIGTNDLSCRALGCWV